MPQYQGHIYRGTNPDGSRSGISTDDIKNALSESTDDLGTLCASSKINMWARNKPEAIGGKEPLTDGQRKANNFGLMPPTTYTSIADYVTAANNNFIKGWTYYRVIPYTYKNGQITGGRGDWARESDFEDYQHNAVCPFPLLADGDYVLESSSKLPIRLMAGFEDNGTTNQYIRMSDLQKDLDGIANNQLANYYVGVLFLKDTTHYWIATSSSPIKNNVLDFAITNANNMQVPSAQNGLKGFAFLANKTFQTFKNGTTQGGAVTSVKIVPISSASVNVNILSASATLTVNVSVNGANAIVRVENRGAAVTITPVKFEKSETGTEDKYTNATQIAFMPNADTSAYTVPAGSATSPSVSEKSYSLPIMGMSGYLRFVYNYYRSNSDQANNQRTAWTALFKPSQSS